MTNTDCGFKV